MPLYWSDPDRIATALLETYPDRDRLAISHDELTGLIVNLAGFDDQKQPPKKEYLDTILHRWTRFAHGETDGACQ